MSTIDSDPPESVRSAWQKAIVTDMRAKVVFLDTFLDDLYLEVRFKAVCDPWCA